MKDARSPRKLLLTTNDLIHSEYLVYSPENPQTRRLAFAPSPDSALHLR
jgi:hypothetical protein